MSVDSAIDECMKCQCGICCLYDDSFIIAYERLYFGVNLTSESVQICFLFFLLSFTDLDFTVIGGLSEFSVAFSCDAVD